MAGDHHKTIKLDPAFERWNLMRENYYKNFRFTPSAARKVVLMGVLVPLTVYTLASNQDDQWDFTAKRKDESLRKNPTPPQSTAEE